MDKENTPSNINKLILLRTLVGFLGEKDQCRWWDTSFLGETGQKFLAITYPRSAFAAGLHSVTEAAKRLHDDRIGKSRVFHLFRLPASVEEMIHRGLTEEDNGEILLRLKNREEALKNLRKLFESGIVAPEGPVQVGTERKILTEFAIEEMTKHYYDAFVSGKQSFPYFTAER